MAFRFRQSFTLFPGVRINLSKRGLSLSAGVPGATLNFSPRGTALTVGIPGSGLSYRAQLTGGEGGTERTVPSTLPGAPAAPDRWAFDAGAEPPMARSPASPLPGEIKSADVAKLTSPDLDGLKRLINAAASQRQALEASFREATREREAAWIALRKAEQYPKRLFTRGKIPALSEAFSQAQAEAEAIADAHVSTEVRVDFAFDAAALEAFSALEAAHRRLSSAGRIWDVTSSVSANQRAERTIADSTVTRTPVRLRRTRAGIVAGRWSGLCFENANGEDLELFPGFCLMRRAHGYDYALVDLREMRLEATTTHFIESENVLAGVRVIGHTWAKTNKDGSPDRRFRDNYRIPIVEYGKLIFRSATGVAEAYMVSDLEAARQFGAAYGALQVELRRLAERDADAAEGQVTGAATAAAVSVGERLRLPDLPAVAPDHGVTAAAGCVLAAAAVGAIWFQAGSRETPAGPSPPAQAVVASASVPGNAATAAPAPAARPGGAGSPPSAQPTPPRERVAARQAANVRAEATGTATVLRTAPAGTTFTVFGRSGQWVQIGDDRPAGWIHNSLLGPAP